MVVTLQNPDTQVVTRGITGKNGHYWIAGVPAGPGYRLLFHRAGRKEVVRENLSVDAGATLTVDAQLSEEAIELDRMVVEGRRRSPFAKRIRAPVTAAEIDGLEGMLTAQDILRLLRPGALRSFWPKCQDVEIKVFIDGVRRDWAMDGVGHKRRKLIADLPLNLQLMVGKLPNLLAALIALQRLRAHEIERAEFFDCMDMSVPISRRNSIWIVTRRESTGW